MAPEDLLKAEARERPRMAVAAGVAALFTLASPILGRAVLGGAPDNLPGATLYSQQHQAGLAVAAACSVIGLVAVVVVLDFLYRAIRLRNPQLPAQLRPLPWIGGLGLVVLTIGVEIASSSRLDDFASHGSQTYDEAKAVADIGGFAFAGSAAQLALAFAIVMLSINALRVGLLSRFLGYLGVISAALFILPLVPIPIVQVYWLGALAALFAGRSPSGIPSAWTSGKAEPWPSAAEMRDARVRAAEAGRGEATADSDAALEQGAAAGAARRKRKKRR